VSVSSLRAEALIAGGTPALPARGGSLRLFNYKLQLLFAPSGAHCRQGCLRSQEALRAIEVSRFLHEQARIFPLEMLIFLHLKCSFIVEDAHIFSF
jgi:hypothetical protein